MLSYVSIIGGTVRVEKECTRVRERICVCTLYINWQVVIKCADLSTISSSSPAPVTHKRLQQSESSSPEDHQPSLYLYIPLFPSPPLYLSLLPSSIQSLPLHPSSPFPTVPLDFSSHMLFFTYWPNPPVWVSAFVFLSLSHKILLLFHYSHLPSFSVALSFSQSLLYFAIFFQFLSNQ